MVTFWWLCGDQCHLLQGTLKAYLTTTRGDCVFSSVHLLDNARTDLERGTVSANCMGPSSVNAHHNYDNGNLIHSVELALWMRDSIKHADPSKYALAVLVGLLHDAGKADEYQLTASGGWKLTDRGKLLGHKVPIIFLALVLSRLLRMRLKAKNSPYSPSRMLEVVRGIQHHQVTLHRKQSARGLTTLTPEQKDLFDTVNLPKPSKIAL